MYTKCVSIYLCISVTIYTECISIYMYLCIICDNVYRVCIYLPMSDWRTTSSIECTDSWLWHWDLHSWSSWWV